MNASLRGTLRGTLQQHWQRFTVRTEAAVTFMRLLAEQFRRDGLPQSAAALTYTTLFAIVPILTVTYSILAAIPALQERGEAIQSWALDYFVPDASAQVQEYLGEFTRQAANLTVIGAVFLFVTSILLLRTIESAMNRIWMVSHPRRGVTSLLMYWAVLSLGPLLLGAGLGISSYVTSTAFVTDTVALFGGMRLWLAVLPVLFTTGLLTLLYVVVPNCHVPLRQGLLGGFIAAVLFELAKGGFALFIRFAPTYEVVYGAFAAVPLFLLWIYVSWVIVLAGAQLVRTQVVFTEYRRDAPRLQALLRVIEVLWHKQQRGRVLRPAVLRRTLQAAGATRWDEFRNLLIDLGLVRRTDEGGYVLTRDLRTLSVADLVALTPWPAAAQLRTSTQQTRPWEALLESRCQAARDGLNEPLSLSLEALFLSEKDDSQREQLVSVPASAKSEPDSSDGSSETESRHAR